MNKKELIKSIKKHYDKVIWFNERTNELYRKKIMPHMQDVDHSIIAYFDDSNGKGKAFCVINFIIYYEIEIYSIRINEDGSIEPCIVSMGDIDILDDIRKWREEERRKEM